LRKCAIAACSHIATLFAYFKVCTLHIFPHKLAFPTAILNIFNILCVSI